MPPEKAAKKTAHKAARKAAKHPAKAAKKAAKKGASRHSDLRRAFEHLGRIEILDTLLASSTPAPLTTVVELARQQLTGGLDRTAAELLRAAEHLSFAALEAAGSPAEVSPALETAIAAEFEHLLARTADHRAPDHGSNARRTSKPSAGRNSKPADPLETLIPTLVKQAHAAHQARRFRVALELARAAEALAHLDLSGPIRLAAPVPRRTLR